MPPRDSSMPQPWPAVSPDQTNDTERPSARRGAEAADLRLARRWSDAPGPRTGCDRRCPDPAADSVNSALAVKSLSGSASIATALMDVLEALGGRNLDQHARRTVGSRPDDAGIQRDVARLNAVRDQRPVGGAAHERHRDGLQPQSAPNDPALRSRWRRLSRIARLPTKSPANRSGPWLRRLTFR